MSASARVLKQLFVVLCRIQSSAWLSQKPGGSISGQAYKTLFRLMGYNDWTPILEKEMESLFSGSGVIEVRLSERNKVLYLPPMEEEPDFLPVLSLECRLDGMEDVMKLRVILVHCGEDNETPRGIGFRMEKGESVHSFYHAQLIGNLQGAGDVGDSPVECPYRLPEKQPSIPLKARDVVTLVLCLLISLYGVKWCWTFVSDHQITELTSYLKHFGSPT